MSTLAIIVLPALLLLAGCAWLWLEARRVARPAYAEYNARLDAADRWLDGRESAPARPRLGIDHVAVRSRGDERPDTLAA